MYITFRVQTYASYGMHYICTEAVTKNKVKRYKHRNGSYVYCVAVPAESIEAYIDGKAGGKVHIELVELSKYTRVGTS